MMTDGPAPAIEAGAETEGDPDRPSPPARRSRAAASGPFGLPPGVGWLEGVAAGIVLLVPLLDLPFVDQGPWAFRTALILVVVGPALVVLVELARRGDRAAQCAVGFLVVATVSAVLSATPQISLLGSYGVDRGVLVLAGYTGCWAIGRRVSRDAHQLLAGLFLFTVLLNVGFGVLQVIWGLQLGVLGVSDGRAAGFTPSSVYLGGLTAGGLALVGYLLSTLEWRHRLFVPLLVLAGVFSMGANLTGSRIALIGGVVLAVAAVVRTNWRTALLLLVVLLAGVGASALVHQTASSTSRITSDGSSGISTRVIMWEAAGHSLAHHPLLGVGPGNFRSATSARVTPKFVISEGQDKLFFDAHNVLIEQLTTVGLVGTALLAAWILLAARRARGPMAWLALGIAVTWLLEPVSISTAPVALLALGAAAPAVAWPNRSRAWPAVAAVLGVIGLVAGGMVVLAARDMKQATSSRGTLGEVQAAQRLLPPDGTLDTLALSFWEARAQAQPTPANRAKVVALAQDAVHRDPGRPEFWSALGRAEYSFGDRAAAEPALAHALRLDPWSQNALSSMNQYARLTHQPALVASTNAKLCRIHSGFCKPG